MRQVLRAASRTLIGAAVATVLAAAGAAPPAPAQRGLEIGFLDSLYPDAEQGPRWLDRTRELGADLIRINVRWSGIVNGLPADPTDPADPAYELGAIDRAVRGARARGLRVLLVVHAAPEFAEGVRRPSEAPAGSWKPRPGRLAELATMLARRYSGRFDPADGGGRLPAVRYMAPWNEPNIDLYLTPQWQGGRPFAARHYRRMQNAFYDATKAVRPGAQVLTAGTAPFGHPRGGPAIRPLAFWREALCLRRSLEARPGCVPRRARARFDHLAHHPIPAFGRWPPRRRPANPDDVTVANFGALRRMLRAAERQGTTGNRARHGLWVPEIWWQSKPRREGISRPRQARFMSEALSLLWRAGVRGVSFLQLVDSPHDPALPLHANFQTGVFTARGRRKASYRAVRFPLVAERRSRSRVLIWGKAPRRGRVVIERRARSGWRRVGRTRARATRVFTTRIGVRGAARLRARVGREASRPWRIRR